MALEMYDISACSDKLDHKIAAMMLERATPQYSLSEKVRLLSEMLLRAYQESMSNEGVVTFGSMTELAAAVLEGNSFETTWTSPRYKSPLRETFLSAERLIRELGLVDKHTGL